MGYYAFSRPKPTKPPKGDVDGSRDEGSAADEAKVGGGGGRKKAGGKKPAAATVLVTEEHNGDGAGAKKKSAAATTAIKRSRQQQERVDEPDCKNFGKWVGIPIAENGEAERIWLGQIRAVGVVSGVEKYSVFFEEDGDFLDYDVDQVPILFVILFCKCDELFFFWCRLTRCTCWLKNRHNT